MDVNKKIKHGDKIIKLAVLPIYNLQYSTVYIYIYIYNFTKRYVFWFFCCFSLDLRAETKDLHVVLQIQDSFTKICLKLYT